MAEIVKLKTLIKQIRGVSYGQDDLSPSSTQGYIPLLRATNITNTNTIEKKDFIYVNAKKVSKEQFLRQGDVLIAASSGSIDIVGKSAIFDSDDILTFGAFCKVIRPNNQLVHPKYIGFFFQTDYYRKRISSLARGANINNLKNEHIDDLEILLPDLDTQNKIVAILDKANNIIEKREMTINKYDELLKATFWRMFGSSNPDFKNWVELPITSLLKDSNRSARTGPFGSALKHERFQEAGDVAVLGIDNAVDNVFAWKKRRFLPIKDFEEFKNYQVFPRDVIITIMGTVGRSAVIPENIGLAINTKHLAALTLNEDKCNPFYLAFSIHSNPYLTQQFRGRSRGAIMEGFNLTLIKALKLKCPPITLQNQFESIYRKCQISIHKLNTANSISRTLLNTLFHLAFNGDLTFNTAVELEAFLNKIDLNNDKDNDISAAKLNKALISLLISRLNKQEFENFDQYEKGKYVAFRILKEEDLIRQEYNSNNEQIELILK